MSIAEQSPLGKATVYAGRYDPSLLFPIERAPQRSELGIGDAPTFHGTDIWNAYELSWLDARGKPQVAMAELRVPATSRCLIESKSLKLYLNGFAGERLTADTLVEHVRHDLSAAAGDDVGVRLIRASAFAHQQLVEPDGTVIDDLEIDIDHYGPPRAEFLRAAESGVVRETLVSHLLKSNCPVTGQPDWGSVQIIYTGTAIDRAGLLRYLISFRDHNAFHEQCVERIFVDITRRCAPTQLAVYARYTRRGGLDINPFRSSVADAAAPRVRLARQ